MVVVVYHLPFIQRQDVLFRLRQEEAAIRGHVEQALSEFNPPRIFFHILPHQDGCAAVELAAQAGVFATPEERAGARIRVDQGKVLCRHRKMAPFVCQLPRVDQVVGEVRLFRRRQGECAKALAAVHIREKFLPVLKVVERGQLSALHNGLEKSLGGIIRGNAGGNDESGAPVRSAQLAVQLGKEGVEIDNSHTRQGEATAVLRRGVVKQAFRPSQAQGGFILAEQGLFPRSRSPLRSF